MVAAASEAAATMRDRKRTDATSAAGSPDEARCLSCTQGGATSAPAGGLRARARREGRLRYLGRSGGSDLLPPVGSRRLVLDTEEWQLSCECAEHA